MECFKGKVKDLPDIIKDQLVVYAVRFDTSAIDFDAERKRLDKIDVKIDTYFSDCMPFIEELYYNYKYGIYGECEALFYSREYNSPLGRWEKEGLNYEGLLQYLCDWAVVYNEHYDWYPTEYEIQVIKNILKEADDLIEPESDTQEEWAKFLENIIPASEQIEDFQIFWNKYLKKR